MRALPVAALLLLAACGPVDTTRWQARQAAIDPPMLWRVRVVGGPVASNPVQVCADSIMHGGFMEPMPTFAGQRCQPVDGRRALGPDHRLLCESQGRRYAVTSHLVGDPEDTFSVRFAVRSIGPGGAYEQTRRYERLGRCPAGWKVGAHTDQQGRRHADARW